MSNEERNSNYHLLKQRDWSKDVEQVRHDVLVGIDGSARTPTLWRTRFVPLATSCAVLLIGIVGWVGFTMGSFDLNQKDGITVTIQPQPIEKPNESETVLASAETVPFDEPKIAMRILTEDPNVIILLVD